MLREGPRLAAVGCETGDWSHVDVYLTKTTDYRLLVFAGSGWEPQLAEWTTARGSTVVGVGGKRPGRSTRCAIRVTPTTTSGCSPKCWYPNSSRPGPGNDSELRVDHVAGRPAVASRRRLGGLGLVGVLGPALAGSSPNRASVADGSAPASSSRRIRSRSPSQAAWCSGVAPCSSRAFGSAGSAGRRPVEHRRRRRRAGRAGRVGRRTRARRPSRSGAATSGRGSPSPHPAGAPTGSARRRPGRGRTAARDASRRAGTSGCRASAGRPGARPGRAAASPAPARTGAGAAGAVPARPRRTRRSAR